MQGLGQWLTSITVIAGLKLAIVSNFDTRLGPILQQHGLARLFDSVLISAEVGVEKPNPVIFERACQILNVLPEETVHVGDDRRCKLALFAVWRWGASRLADSAPAPDLQHVQVSLVCRNDITGARDAGCFAWLWGLDVLTFDEVAKKMLHEERDEPDSDAILSPLW